MKVTHFINPVPIVIHGKKVFVLTILADGKPYDEVYFESLQDMLLNANAITLQYANQIQEIFRHREE